eukprot:1147666-Pelagomonas_calceolata.AAC.11
MAIGRQHGPIERQLQCDRCKTMKGSCFLNSAAYTARQLPEHQLSGKAHRWVQHNIKKRRADKRSPHAVTHADYV